MPASNIRLSLIEDTTVNITAGKRRNMFSFDSTKDHAIYYKSDGTTLRHFIMGDSANNLIQTINTMSVAGVLTAAGTLDVTGDLTAEGLFHKGDSDTNITFAADNILLTAGGVSFISLAEDTQDVLTINPDSVDLDFRVNVNGEVCLFIEGSSGKVCIGTTTPPTPAGAKLTISDTIAAGNVVQIITNLATDGTAILALSEDNAATPFYIERAGSTHASRAGYVRIIQGLSYPMQLLTNNATRIEIEAAGNVKFFESIWSPKGKYHYIGDPAAQYSWRIGSAAGANDLVFEYAATADVWTEKGRVVI